MLFIVAQLFLVHVCKCNLGHMVSSSWLTKYYLAFIGSHFVLMKGWLCLNESKGIIEYE